MFEIMLIIEGTQVVHHSYDSKIAPVAGDVITINEVQVFNVKKRLLGGVNGSNKIICFGLIE